MQINSHSGLIRLRPTFRHRTDDYPRDNPDSFRVASCQSSSDENENYLEVAAKTTPSNLPEIHNFIWILI